MSEPIKPNRAESAAFDAVIFDMDGVVTDTAQAHAAAWKRLFDAYFAERAARGDGAVAPFDAQDDYRRHVDGKARHDGVASVLAARGIDLPFGTPDDGPGAETVCGLANRKNGIFRAWLDTNRVRVHPATVRLVKTLRAAGVKVGLFSASRNAQAVLANAGIAHLFDATLDGADLARLALPGKPDPAMPREAAARLGARADRTVLVEDSVAGVRAGAAGGFARVIGIERSEGGPSLAQAGADAVVRDLAELAFDPRAGFTMKTLAGLPYAFDRLAEIEARLAGRTLAVFLDYDGTLTPIVEDFTKAILADDMRAGVAALAARRTVGVVSGRDLDRLKALVDLDTVLYAGSHGFEVEGPGLKATLGGGEAFLDALDAAERVLSERLGAIEGGAVERKRFALAVHYRRVADEAVPALERIVDEVLGEHPRLRKGYGKKVFELQPRVDWDKGRVVDWLLDRLGLDGDDAVALYIGDDLTDEHAFRALAGRGVAIAVGDDPRATAADYRLADPEDVGRFLGWLRDRAEDER